MESALPLEPTNGMELPEAPARVLIVDDEPVVASVLTEFLSGFGYQIAVSPNGEAAVEQMALYRPDLLLTDINLPGISGLEVMRFAKSLDAEVVVIVVTGHASTSSAIDALRQGAYDYVTKPFDLSEVHQIIERGLASRRLHALNRHLLQELRQANQTLQSHEEELREKVAMATWQMTTLYEVGKEIISNLELEPRLQVIAVTACRLTGAKGAVIYLRREEGEEFRAVFVHGLDQRPADLSAAGFATGEGDNGVVAFEGRAVRRHAEAGKVDLELPGFGAQRFFSLLALPMMAAGQVLGVLDLVDKIGSFGRDDESFLTLFAAQAGIAIHNSLLFERTKSLDRLKSEFVAVVSHEIRTPLTSIKGSIELLSDDRYFQTNDQQQKLLAIAHANCERLLLLINDILDFSKLESSRLPVEVAPGRVDPVIHQGIQALRTLLDERQIRVEVRIEPELPDLWMDSHRIQQVITNLLSNAIKFSVTRGTIEITVERWNGGARIGVRDHGEGIAAEDLGKLFRKFSQLDSSSTRRAGGTGLGLVICKGIVEQHGGKIWVESDPGTGSCFYFTLSQVASGLEETRSVPAVERGPSLAS